MERPFGPAIVNESEIISGEASSMFFTYILRSVSSGRFYVGHTSDSASRLVRHNENREKATKNRGPWEVVFRKSFETKAEAQKFEYYIKSKKSRGFIEKLVSEKNGFEHPGM